MDRKENIRNAYRLTGSNNFYDGMVTCSTVSGKAVCRLVWDMGKEECGEYLNKALLVCRRTLRESSSRSPWAQAF